MANSDSQVLFEAIQKGDADAVRALLERYPSLATVQTEQGTSAVLLAVYYGKPGIARLLAESGLPLTIFEAAALGRLDRVQELTAQNPALKNDYSQDGFQPLGLAAFFGHKAIVDYLLEQDAEVNSPSRNGQRVMPLHSAVAAQQVAIAEALILHGADINAVQGENFTPLHGAAQNGQVEMVRLLLDHGALANVRDMSDRTPLDLALREGHGEAADLLRQP